MRLDFFVKSKCLASTVMLSHGIKYSLRDLIYNVTYRACSEKLRHASNGVNGVIGPSCISSSNTTFLPKPYLDGFMNKIFSISVFSF